MDIYSLFTSTDVSETLTVADMFFSLLLSLGLSLAIAWVYKSTHRGTSYSQSYVQNLILLSMIVAVVMLVVGSNIARAFGLIGALSIIRFRNAIKETRDVGFIFLVMAIGMAAGTGFYLLAVIATVVIGFVLWEMNALNLFAKETTEQMLKVWVSDDIDYETEFERLFPRYLVSYKLLSVKAGKDGVLTKLDYLVEFREQANKKAFMDEIRKLTYNKPVSLELEQAEQIY